VVAELWLLQIGQRDDRDEEFKRLRELVIEQTAIVDSSVFKTSAEIYNKIKISQIKRGQSRMSLT